MATHLALPFLLAIKIKCSRHSDIMPLNKGDFMGKLNVDKVAFWVTMLFIIVAPVENILKTEQFVYAIGILVLGACSVNRRLVYVNNSK